MAISEDGKILFDFYTILLFIRISNNSYKTFIDEEFLRSIHLAISLLNGGNSEVQQSFLEYFGGKNGDRFFQKVFI